MVNQHKNAGLRGRSAGETAVSTVKAAGNKLRYRGYDVEELAQHATFNEVAHLLLKGELPNRAELDAYTERLVGMRGLPQTMREILERIPASAHPMEVLRTGCSLLGNIEPEGDFTRQQDVADRMLALFPAIMAYWYRFSHDGARISTDTDETGIGAHLLHMLHGRAPGQLARRAMDASLILYAEHEFNASTFTARVCASTMSDLHSCIAAAIGALRGPLHGGANQAAMDMLARYASVEEARADVLRKLAAGELIMGFGHAVYRERDPRNAIIKHWSRRLAKEAGNDNLFRISEAIERLMEEEKRLFANTDFYHASAYHFMNIPTRLFTPVFAMSRVTGWSAHCFEQRAINRIIQPAADYTGPAERPYLPIGER